MESICSFIPYKKTGYFSTLVTDYLQCHTALQPFYNYEVSIEGIKKSIASRKLFLTNRILLVNELTKQYNNISLTMKQQKNLNSLLSENTFTITTAHQPNIFTGPLYFIYKIIHVIKIADELSAQIPNSKFVPVYYMGSEDADLDELGYIFLNGEKIKWHTSQTGAVGRMKVDKDFIKIIDLIHGQIGVHFHGKKLSDLFKKSYTEGKTIQQATLELVNDLFADFGLIILIPDNAALKKSFQSIVEKELTEQFSHTQVEQTINAISKNYKVQTNGRKLNLFYLIDDKRERIELLNNKFYITNLQLSFTKEEILNELKNHPEHFSGNVILRAVFQETILPNIAFIGGGGELAYWLELKNVFQKVQVPYPMLILRNSFLWITNFQLKKLQALGFQISDLFKKQDQLLNELVHRESLKQLNISTEVEKINQVYQQLQKISGSIDISLSIHTKALQVKAFKLLKALEKKMLHAEKRKFSTQQEQIKKLKQALFPNENLQERIENFSLYYAQFGKEWLQNIYDATNGLSQDFCILIPNSQATSSH